MIDQFRVRPGDMANLDAREPSSTDGAPGDADKTRSALAELTERLAGLQDRLWAEGRRSLLVVLQGIDTSGKDEAIRSLFARLNPQGLRVETFRVPSADELRHDFLWRVHAHTPGAGEIAVFNRSHYEDVLSVRVHGLVPAHVYQARYEHINCFERLLAHSGTRVVKLFFHLSAGEQLHRLESRLDEPEKRWRLDHSDLDGARLYDKYRLAATDMIERTSTDQAPWFIIPADHRWYRDWAAAEVLVKVLRDIDPRYPPSPALPERGRRQTVR
ncbi:MAG: PPK2 family polyphosphate kinase [Acidimicrobiales bacterium]